jgi:hypothetical protein
VCCCLCRRLCGCAAIPGLQVGFTLRGGEIVQNGLPRPGYEASRALSLESRAPSVVVGANATVSTLYISYQSMARFFALARRLPWARSAANAAGDRSASEAAIRADSATDLEIGDPIVSITNGFANPVLTGIAADGGKLVKNGPPLELDVRAHTTSSPDVFRACAAVLLDDRLLCALSVDCVCRFVCVQVTYNCLEGQVGTEGITIKIPLIPARAGAVRFTIAKQCNGLPHLQGVYVTGLKIATEPDLMDAADVVFDGFTRPSYSSHKLVGSNEPRYEAPMDEALTTFFVRYKNRWAETMRALEPVVVARPPICNPSIEQSFT